MLKNNKTYIAVDLDRRDCVVGEWSEWSSCGKSCAKARKTRERKVILWPRNGGKKCPRLRARKKCTCVIRDCKVSEWSKWGACSKTCGTGRRHRTRKLLEHPTKGGRRCPVLKERQNCNAFTCRGEVSCKNLFIVIFW